MSEQMEPDAPDQTTQDSPNEGMPGSDAAVQAGCRCSVVGNARGRGRNGDGDRYGWFIDADCPLHKVSNSPGGRHRLAEGAQQGEPTND